MYVVVQIGTLSKSNVGCCFRVSKLVTFFFSLLQFQNECKPILFTCAKDVY